jgi:hypothetical protein
MNKPKLIVKTQNAENPDLTGIYTCEWVKDLYEVRTCTNSVFGYWNPEKSFQEYLNSINKGQKVNVIKIIEIIDFGSL